jgi:DNA 3'-phosphatase
MAKEVCGKWHQYKSVLFYIPPLEYFYTSYDDTSSPDIKDKVKLAGFDMDGTLINSNRGARYATEESDWLFAFENVPDILKSYRKKGYQVCIISNRKAGINTPTVKKTQKRVMKFFEKAGIQCFAFLLTKDDTYRKPSPLVLSLLLKLLSCDSFIEGSFYCGDAALGAPNSSESPWCQWSDVDYKLTVNWNKKFGENGKLNFYDADAMFIPEIVPDYATYIFQKCYDYIQENEVKNAVFITCGQPGSGYDFMIGKSVFVHTIKNIKFICGKINTIIKEIKSNVSTVNTVNTVYIVCGSNPKVEDRQEMANYINDNSEYIVLWFSRPTTNNMSRYEEAKYSKEFEFPNKEAYIRAN